MTMAIPIPAPSVSVFNADYSHLTQVDYRAAVSMLVRKVAYALELHDPPRVLRSPSFSIELPRSLMLTDYVHIPYRRLADHASRAEILDRDRRMCQFVGCGARATTIDHLLPRCRGGGNTWDNLVASCADCNGRKGDRTPAEAGMRLIREPFRPASV
ncbi:MULTISPECIES: HNH endonuclease [Mycolicibacter]|uniref:HNH endonuclease n=2 Tax=Mycolicibacter TaxID=1073531 RepID=A0ABU5XM98_9MYCO|nr:MULTISPECIES: HNH endonuclease [unclassified Mycolicibacter]MEB3023392.1 HNH endonuclease [Mycolicibacter sp. MYC098]MEB3033734.1 HNH endonuclease [Mycolicibacter sp. MYC340]